MLALTQKYATLSKFRSATPKILCGNLLKDVCKLQISIQRYGIIEPLTVIRNHKRLIVVDGRKRLMALRRLMFNKALPAKLSRVPYRVIEQSSSDAKPRQIKDISLADAYAHIKRQQEKGRSISDIARRARVSKDTIRRVLTIDNLSPRLKNGFLKEQLTAKQALAFATLPNCESQDALYDQLGPHIDDNSVIKAIMRGETVLPLSDNDVVILPSRNPLRRVHSYAA